MAILSDSLPENSLSSILADAPVAIGILRGEEMTVEFANPALLQLWGKSNDIIGYPLIEALPEIIGQPFPYILKEVYVTGMDHHGNETLAMLNRGGRLQECYFNFVYTPIREAGTVTGISVVASEVTSQVMAKKEIALSENRFRNLVLDAPVATAIYHGEDMVIQLANEAMLHLWGKDASVIGKKLREALPELDGQPFHDLLDEVYKTGVTYRSKEGKADLIVDGRLQSYYFNFTYKALKNAEGEIYAILNMAVDITDQVLSKNKINESEQRLRIAIEAADMGTFDLDMLQDKVVYSERFAEIFSISQGEKLTPDYIIKRIHPEDADKRLKAYQDAYVTGILTYEVRLIMDEGNIKWIKADGKILYDHEGTPYRMYGTVLDITREKEAFDSVKESELQLRQLINGLPIAFYTVDETGRLNLFNEAAVILWGRNPEKGKDFWCGAHKLFLADGTFLPHDECPVAIAFRQNKRVHAEAIVERPDGEKRYVLAYAQPISNIEDRQTGAMNVVVDITDRKKVERDLLKSEAKFRLLSDIMPQFIWTSDRKGKLNYFSPSLGEYSGKNIDDFLVNDAWLEIVHPEEREQNIIQWLESVRTGDDFIFEHRFLRHDGTYRWQLSRAVPQKNSKGEIQMWVGTSTDIHDRITSAVELERQVELRTAELLKLNEQLLQTNHELEQFAYVASHDLQEPLRKIQTFIGLIQQNREDKDKSDSYFEKVNKSAKRMSRLINDVLDYSRLSKVEDQFSEMVDLNEILENIKIDFELLVEEKNAVIVNDVLPVIKGNPLQLNQLFFNLLSNSLKFCDKAPLISITCQWVEADQHEQIPGKHLVLTFKDNGIGFEQQYAEKIFTIFQRLNVQHEYSGTGIGLAVCKKIVDNHKGIITAQSKLNAGAEFNVYLPV